MSIRKLYRRFWRRRSYSFRITVKTIKGGIFGAIFGMGIIKCLEIVFQKPIGYPIVIPLVGISALVLGTVAMRYYEETHKPYRM